MNYPHQVLQQSAILHYHYCYLYLLHYFDFDFVKHYLDFDLVDRLQLVPILLAKCDFC